MHSFLLYGGLILVFMCFLVDLNAHARINKIKEATKDLDWDAIANLTGDIATVKKTIQTLNNRMSGMNSPKLAEQELITQFMQQQQQPANGKIRGG